MGAPQLFTDAIIDSVHVCETLVVTGLAFAMLSTALYAQLSSKPPIQPFKQPALDIVGVGGARAKVKMYIDEPLQLGGIEVAHPLLVVTDLSFPIFVGTDILRAHSATMSFGDAVPLRLNARVCNVCLEQPTELSCEF